MQKAWARSQEQSQRSTRISDGVQDVLKSTKSERDRILEVWSESKDRVEERKKIYKMMLQKDHEVTYEGATLDTRPGPASRRSSSGFCDLGGSAGTQATTQIVESGINDSLEHDLGWNKRLAIVSRRQMKLREKSRVQTFEELKSREYSYCTTVKKNFSITECFFTQFNSLRYHSTVTS
jgi:hypothetical protein